MSARSGRPSESEVRPDRLTRAPAAPMTEGMAASLDDLSTKELEQIEQARVRAASHADRRELVTEVAVAGAFLALAALLLAVAGGGEPGLALWLAGLYLVLVRIDF